MNTSYANTFTDDFIAKNLDEVVLKDEHFNRHFIKYVAFSLDTSNVAKIKNAILLLIGGKQVNYTFGNKSFSIKNVGRSFCQFHKMINSRIKDDKLK